MRSFRLKEYMVEPGNMIAKRMIYKDTKVAGFVLNIAKGSSLPDHTHFDSTVLIQVLKGTSDAKVDGQVIPMETGSLLQLEGNEKFSVNNSGDETLSLYVTLSPNPPPEQYTEDVDI